MANDIQLDGGKNINIHTIIKNTQPHYELGDDERWPYHTAAQVTYCGNIESQLLNNALFISQRPPGNGINDTRRTICAIAEYNLHSFGITAQ